MGVNVILGIEDPYMIPKFAVGVPANSVKMFFTNEDSIAMKTFYRIEAIKEEWKSRETK